MEGCQFWHVRMSAKDLASRCQESASLRAVMASKGGPTTMDRRARPKEVSLPAQEAPPAPHGRRLLLDKKRVGAKEEILVSDSDTEEEEGSSYTDEGGYEGLGGRSSGVAGVERRVPVEAYVAPFYPAMQPVFLEAVGPPPRVTTVHPDAPPRKWGEATPLQPHAPATLTRVGRCEGRPAFAVKEGLEGKFSVLLGPLQVCGFEAGQHVRINQTVVDNACVVTTFASLLGMCPSSLYLFLLTAAYAAIDSLGPPAQRESRTTSQVRHLAHDVAAYARCGHPLDALLLLWFPPAALDTRRVMMIHYKGEDVAIDIVRGCASTDDTPWLLCLQSRGNPGHLRPLDSISGPAGRDLLLWARQHGIVIRDFQAVGWRQLVDGDLSGASVSWQPPRLCDFCHQPASPLPPTPL